MATKLDILQGKKIVQTYDLNMTTLKIVWVLESVFVKYPEII